MLPHPDLNHVFLGCTPVWEQLRGKRIFITGATGIIGKWLLETLQYADGQASLGIEVYALSRRPEQFARIAPHLAAWNRLRLLAGDVRTVEFPEGSFDLVIHAATDVIAPQCSIDIFDTCVIGTRRVIDFAVNAGAADFLLLSSGAVYGPQPPAMAKIPEDYHGGPDPTRPDSAYGEGKRASEWLAVAVSQEHQTKVKIARIYALVGPYLPLDKHFAIGNFIHDALTGSAVHVRGDGTNQRSYLHLADVSKWLWTIAIFGRRDTAYNVGSSDPISVGELASLVTLLVKPGLPVVVHGEHDPAKALERYIPDIGRAWRELGLTPEIDLEQAIRRTAQWCLDRSTV